MSEKRLSQEHHHEAMKKSGFYSLGKTSRDAHLMSLSKECTNPLFFMPFMASW